MTRRWTWCCAGVGCTLFFVHPDFQMFHSFILIGLFPNKLVKFYRSYWLSIRAFCRLHFFAPQTFVFLSTPQRRIASSRCAMASRHDGSFSSSSRFLLVSLSSSIFSHTFSAFSRLFPLSFIIIPYHSLVTLFLTDTREGRRKKTIAPWQILAERVHNLCGSKRIRS